MKTEAILLISLSLVFLFGLLLAFFPELNGWRQDRSCRKTVDSFFEHNQGMTETEEPPDTVHDNANANPPMKMRKYPELWDAIMSYNTELQINKQAGLNDPAAYETDPICIQNYGFPNAAFGVLSIPDIQVELPLYIGANAENMANGAAILGQTSIPIGGADTNAVIAGHRGWHGSAYFLDINLLEPDDEIIITNPWEMLTYVVVETKIISPDDIPSILIQPDRELVTLLSCHPVASGGKQRYLVICERESGNE